MTYMPVASITRSAAGNGAKAEVVPKPPVLTAVNGEQAPLLHDHTGLPMTPEGWTDLHGMITSEAYADARIVYVSSEQGNDATAQTYSPGAAELGGSPLQPVSIEAYRSFEEAIKQLRNGYPDVLLFRRGESFDGAFPDSGGRDSDARRIYGAYGSGPRPRFDLDGTSNLWSDANDLVFADLIMVNAEKDPAHPNFNATASGGLRVMYDAHDILFENVLIKFAGLSFNTEKGHQYAPYNIAFRRSVVTRNYSTTGHAQGVFVNDMEDRGYFLIDECVFDANGYLHGVAEPTWFNRNMYISQVPNAVVRKTISARGASGDQLRRGGRWEKNLSLKQAWTLGVGHPENRENATTSIVIRDNVSLDSANIGEPPYADAQGPRGMGFGLGTGIVSGTVVANILAHNRSGSGNFNPLYFNHDEDEISSNITVKQNIVYGWEGPGLGFRGSAGPPHLVNILVKENDFVMTQGGFGVSTWAIPKQEILFSSNVYYSSDKGNRPFRVDTGSETVELTASEWQVTAGEENAAFEIPEYSDPERTIVTYMEKLGEVGLSYDEALELFLKRAKANEKGSWDDRYTAISVINYIREGFDRRRVSF